MFRSKIFWIPGLIAFGVTASIAAETRPRGAPATSAETQTSAPTNYRQLVARKLLESHYGPDIRRANISRPYNQIAGLFGGTRPAVCVELFRETPLFSNARDIWFFTFQDGQVDNAWIGGGTASCTNMSPLYELRRKT